MYTETYIKNRVYHKFYAEHKTYLQSVAEVAIETNILMHRVIEKLDPQAQFTLLREVETLIR